MGITAVDVTLEVTYQLGYEQKSGAIISKIEAESPAVHAGLRPGILIVEVDGKKVNNGEGFKTAMKTSDLKTGVLLLIQSQQGASYLILSE